MHTMNFDSTTRDRVLSGARAAFLVEVPGSPCPTCVLDARELPTEDRALLRVLVRVRAELVARGHGNVLKFALISPETDPWSWADLQYRFVQCLPGEPDRFDLRGNCGHSILGSIMAARRMGWLPRLAPGAQVRVNVVNSGEWVIAEVSEAAWPHAEFIARFRPTADSHLGDALRSRQPITEIGFEHRRIPISFITVGNPYVFVDARTLDLHSERDLFSEAPELYRMAKALREAAIAHLGLPGGGAFPKLALIGQFEPGRLAMRSLSVPGWHPTLALTGTVCTAAASAIERSIPFELSQEAGLAPGGVVIQTPGGVTSAIAEVTGTSLDDHLRWTSVGGKRARYVKRISLDRVPGQRGLCLVAPSSPGRRPARTRRSRSAARAPLPPSFVIRPAGQPAR